MKVISPPQTTAEQVSIAYREGERVGETAKEALTKCNELEKEQLKRKE